MNILTQTSALDTNSRMINMNASLIHAVLPNGDKIITREFSVISDELVKPDWPIIDDFFWTYETSSYLAGNPKDDTKRKNVVAMRIASWSVLASTPQSATYAISRVRYRTAVSLSGMYVRIMRTMCGWHALMFSKRWIMFYRSQNIDTRPFANWVALPLQGIKVKQFDPSRQELERIVDNCEALIVNDPMMWRMYALAYGFGLRSSEIKRARWGDLMEDFDGNKLIRIHSPKSGGKWQDRPVDPAWWDKLFSHKASHDDLIVPVQEDRITREFPQFLRDVCGVVDPDPCIVCGNIAGTG